VLIYHSWIVNMFLRFNLLWNSWEIMEWCRWFLLTSFQRYRGCAQVDKGKQFLLHVWHTSCCCSNKSGDKLVISIFQVTPLVPSNFPYILTRLVKCDVDGPYCQFPYILWKHGINWIDINDIKRYIFTYFLNVDLV
jgi:hypothetical protein